MKLKCFGYAAQILESSTGPVEVTQVEDGYSLFPIWGGIIVQNGNDILTFGNGPLSVHASLVCSGDSTLLHTDNTVTWDCFDRVQCDYVSYTPIIPSTPDTIIPSTPNTVIPSTPDTIIPSSPNTLIPSTPDTIIPSTPNTLIPSTPDTVIFGTPETLIPDYPTPNVTPHTNTPDSTTSQPTTPHSTTVFPRAVVSGVATRCRLLCVTEAHTVVELTPTSSPVEYVLEYPLPLKVTSLAVGAGFNLALGNCGIVWSWGLNNHGQLGLGHINSVSVPTPIEDLGGINVKRIGAGYWHAVAITEFYVAYSWGWNNRGQLGLSQDNPMECCPVPLFGEDTEVDMVACGRSHTAFLDTDGRLFICGFNKYGQCGRTEQESVFINNTMIPDERLAEKVLDLQCGPWSTYFIT